MSLMIEFDIGYLLESNGQSSNYNQDCFQHASAPGRIGRGREGDRLLMQIHFQSGSRESQDNSKLLTLAQQQYYISPGSVTAAARKAMNSVNAYLLDVNRRGAAPPLQAGMTCAVIRGTDLYITQAGPGNALVLRQHNVEQFPEREYGLRPMGMADKIEVHYFHTLLDEGDLLWMAGFGIGEANLMALRASKNRDWQSSVASLRELTNGNIPAMLCRFCAPGEQGQIVAALDAGNQVASVVQTVNGGESISRVESLSNLAVSSGENYPAGLSTDQEPKREELVSAQGRVSDDNNSFEDTPIIDDVGVSTSSAVSEIAGISADVLKPMAVPSGAGVGHSGLPARGQRSKNIGKSQSSLMNGIFEPTAVLARKWYLHLPLAAFQQHVENSAASLTQSLGSATQKIAARVLPGSESEVRLPASAPLWFAGSVPVLVVVLTILAYIQFGRVREFNYYLDEARAAARIARLSPDSATGIPYWRQVIEWVGQAQDIRHNHPEVFALQQAAQTVIDGADRVERVRVEAITADGFRPDANLVEILARGSSLYTLDDTNQAVYRAVLTTSGEYQMDPVFDCSRGPVGMQSIDSLVDITWLNMPNVVGQDTLLALDPAGRLLYCTTDGAMAATVLTPPYDGWTGPVAIEAFQNRIYVLEPEANEIWVYEREDKFYSNYPERYFSESAIDLSKATDISIVQGTVFILHSDGHMTQCVRRDQDSPPECSIETRFSDGRPGRADSALFEGLESPSAMVAYAPPHSSLYLADLVSSGAYQFSLRLAYQREFRAVYENSEITATSFAVGTGRDMFFAAGNNVYVGKRP